MENISNDHARISGNYIPLSEQDLLDIELIGDLDDDDDEDICDECGLPADECECELGDED